MTAKKKNKPFRFVPLKYQSRDTQNYKMTIARINIKGQIGNTYNTETGAIEVKGVELADVIMQVKANETAEVLEFWIDSPGGSIDVGRAIANYVGSLPNAWTIAGEFCASMGTEIHLAVPLERRKKLAGGQYIIHNPLLDGVRGNAAQLHEAADYIETYETEMLSMYTKATGLGKAELEGLMGLETNLTDDQLIAFKFVATIIPKPELKAVAFTTSKQKNQNTINMENTVAEGVKKGFAEFFASLGIKPKTPAPAAKPVAKAEDTKKIARVVKGAAPKAEVLTTDADVAVYTDKPIADFIADPSTEIKVFSDEAMATAMPDGDYTMKDGAIITVKGGILDGLTPAPETEATVDELKAEVARLKAENESQASALREEFTAELNTQLTALKAELGSNYVVKKEAQVHTATRGTTTVINKKPGAGLSMREKAEQEKQGYKGEKKPEGK